MIYLKINSYLLTYLLNFVAEKMQHFWPQPEKSALALKCSKFPRFFYGKAIEIADQWGHLFAVMATRVMIREDKKSTRDEVSGIFVLLVG